MNEWNCSDVSLGEIQDNLVLSAELIMKIGLRKDFLEVTVALFALTKS